METSVKTRRSAGWQEEETKRLLHAVKEAAQTGEPLRSVFEALSGPMGRKPNSIRNHYYACLHDQAEGLKVRGAPTRSFTPEETHELLRRVLMARGQGESVRSCVMGMAQGDHSRMLRYQNKYRTLLRQRPELIDEVCRELEAEGLPFPESAAGCADAAFCDPEDTAASRMMAEPCVAAMLEGVKELLRRAARASEADERLRQLDRMRVEHDLRRLEWEKDFSGAAMLLENLLTLLRDFLALPEDSQAVQLGVFRDAAMEQIKRCEEFLTRMEN